MSSSRPRPVKNDDLVLVLSRAPGWCVFLVSPLESGGIRISNLFVQHTSETLSVQLQTTLLLVELERVDPVV